MSLKTIVQSITSWAENFIRHILPDSRKVIDVAAYIVNGFKTIDQNHPEILNALVALIPGTVDDAILAGARTALPKVLVDLKIVQDEVDKTPEQIVADAVAIVNSSPLKGVLLGSIWTALSNELTQDGVSVADLQKLQQVFYEQIGKDLK